MNKIKKNKYILGIETTSKICGVAISKNNNIIDSINTESDFAHSVVLYTNLDELFKRNRISINDIDLIRVSCGPGSFTGIRIGIACALGLSMPNDINLEYVNTLKSLSNNLSAEYDYIIPMLDAKCNRIYMSIYKTSNKSLIYNNCIENVDNLISLINKYFSNKNISFCFVGDAVNIYREVFKNKLKIKYDLIDLLPNANNIVLTKGEKSKKPFINYILKSKAERERCQR